MLSGNGSFHIGDKVVYPNHGVGVIEQISSRTIGETVEKFYLLKIKSSSLKVMVPFHNVDTVGLRRVIVKNGEIQKIIDFHDRWRMRQQRRLEIPLQRKFRAHAHRIFVRSGQCAQSFAGSEPVQVAFIPGKENAGTCPLSSGQRVGNGKKLRRAAHRGVADESLVQVKPTIPRSLGIPSVSLFFEALPDSHIGKKSGRVGGRR